MRRLEPGSARDRAVFRPCRRRVLVARLTRALRADPFCTIEPNESRCAVPDERYDWLCGEHAPLAFHYRFR